MCTVLLPPGGYPFAVNKCIIYQLIVQTSDWPYSSCRTKYGHSSRTAQHGQEWWRSSQIRRQSRNPQHSTELECSLPSSQNLAIYLHPKLHQSSSQNPVSFFRSTL